MSASQWWFVRLVLVAATFAVVAFAADEPPPLHAAMPSSATPSATAGVPTATPVSMVADDEGSNTAKYAVTGIVLGALLVIVIGLVVGGLAMDRAQRRR